MSADDPDPLTPHERAELEAWRTEEPPPGVESRVLSSLRSHGAFIPAARRSRPLLAMAAAMLFALGLVSGLGIRRPDAARPDSEPRFILLLSAAPAVSAAEEAQRVREYGAWAAPLAARGRLLAGEKLGDAGETLMPSGPRPAADPVDAVQGYFVIRARNLDEAVALARTCPHLRHGGRVTVRVIEPT